MKNKIENLQSHNQQVGLKHYLKTAENTRCNFISQLSSIESTDINIATVPEHIMKKRQKKNEEEGKNIVQNAKEVLRRDKMKKEGTN